MSAELQWAIIRSNSSFLVRNRVGARAIFSTEKGNLTNKNSFKANGLVNKKTVDVSPAEKGRGVVVSLRSSNRKNQPKNVFKKVSLTGGARPTNKAIAGLTAGSNVRGDLKAAAIARASAILLSQKKKAPKTKKIGGRRGKAASA